MIEHGKEENQQNKVPIILKCQTTQAPLETCFYPLSFPKSYYQGSGFWRESNEWSRSFCQSTLKTEFSPSRNWGGTPSHPAHSCIVTVHLLSWFTLLAEHPGHWPLWAVMASSHGMSCDMTWRDPLAASRVWWDMAVQEQGTLVSCGWRGEIKISLFSAVLCVIFQLAAAIRGSLEQCLRCKQNSQKSFPGLLRVIHIH